MAYGVSIETWVKSKQQLNERAVLSHQFPSSSAFLADATDRSTRFSLLYVSRCGKYANYSASWLVLVCISTGTSSGVVYSNVIFILSGFSINVVSLNITGYNESERPVQWI